MSGAEASRDHTWLQLMILRSLCQHVIHSCSASGHADAEPVVKVMENCAYRFHRVVTQNSTAVFFRTHPTSTWPHLRRDVGLEEGEKLCVTVSCTIIIVHKGILGCNLAWFSSLSSKRLCVLGLYGAIY